MPLKLQAHVDSRIWSLQSTVSFFFLSSIWYSEVLFAFKLGLQRVYFFQNVRKMHFFPMFRNGVKWHKCHIPSNTIRCPAFPYVHIFGLLRIPFFVLRTKASASMALTNKNNKNKTTTTKQNNPPLPPKKNKNKNNNNNNKKNKKNNN